MHVKVKIKGTSPLVMHRFNETAELAVENKNRKVQNQRKMTPKEQAEDFLYHSVNDDSIVVLPANNFHRALIEAGRFHKLGKKQLTTATSSIVAPLLCPVEMEFVLSPQEWIVDAKSIVNSQVGARRMVYRPRFDNWSFDCTLYVDEDELGEALARALVDDAGRKVGIGSMRPEKKGAYGCFRVDEWKPEKE